MNASRSHAPSLSLDPVTPARQTRTPPGPRPLAARRRRGLAASAGLALTTLTGAALLLASTPAEAQYTRVSVGHDGSQPTSDSVHSVISGNGRVVAFASDATNLVPNDSNGQRDVFVRDLLTQTTTRVSVSSTGQQVPAGPWMASDEPSLSDDGRIVVFTSWGVLAPEDTAMCGRDGAFTCADVYAHDRDTGLTTLVSVGAGGAAAQGSSGAPVISADGRYVVFESAAANLVPGDVNNAIDIFIRDLVSGTTTLVSTAQGEAGLDSGRAPTISADGKVVAFVAPGWAYPGETDATCQPTGCNRVFVKFLETGQIVRMQARLSRFGGAKLAIDGTGGLVGVGAALIEPNGARYARVEWMETATGTIWRSRTVLDESAPYNDPALTRDGRHLAETVNQLELFDRVSLHTETLSGLLGMGAESPSFSASGRYLAFSTLSSAVVPGDTNLRTDVFVLDRDRDGDGIPTTWELQYGLDPDDPADAGADPDGDGLSSWQEYQVDSHPRGQHHRYFAEGAVNGFFQTRLAVLNPTAREAHIQLRLLGENGQVTVTPRVIAARERITFELMPGVIPDSAFSAVIEADEPVVADRLITWGPYGYGSSLETALPAPATTWYFAEGATGSGFSLYYLLSNPSDIDASVLVEFLRPDGEAVLTTTVPVPKHTRATVDVAAQDPALQNALVSATLTSTQPIVAERALYRTAGGLLYTAGHAGAGITTAAPRWFLAEGATGFFDEYVLVANPGAADTQVTFTFLPQNGTSFQDVKTIPAHSRFTLDVKDYPALAQAAVSIIAESSGGVPVVVERAMWWPSGGEWYEASLSAGVTSTGTQWAIAEGEQGRGENDPLHDAHEALTYVLVANTDPMRDGQAKITLLFEGGGTAARTIDVPANGRATLDVSEIPAAANRRFGIIVEAIDNLPIVVERSLYHNVLGVVYAAGATSVATNITPQQ